jgi:hypothetical protein
VAHQQIDVCRAMMLGNVLSGQPFAAIGNSEDFDQMVIGVFEVERTTAVIIIDLP